MERPEDVSLLASGGAPPTLIPVQGGGGSVPWEGYNAEQSVLANAGGELPQITPVQGGGQISNIIGWLAGAPGTDTPSNAPSMPSVLTPETAVNTLWTNLDDIDKLGAVTDTVQKVAAINAEGGDDMQLANGIVYGLTESVLGRIDRKYGTAPDISKLDETNQDLFKYGTDAQIEAGTEAYRDKCNGMGGQELNKCISEAMEAAANSPNPTYIQVSRINLRRGIVPDEAKKTYATYENKTVYRNEYRLNQEVVIENHPVALWMQYLYKAHIGVNSESSPLFRKFIQFYIQEQKKVWEHTKQLSGKVVQYPLANLSDDNYIIEEADISTFPRRIVCLQKTIEHIVVVPPLDNLKYDVDINIKENFKSILRDLYDMNILKIEEESTKYTCKVHKKVALIFPECYTALTKEASADTANNVLVALYTLELTNPNNVFVMTEYNKGTSIKNSIKYGNYLLSRIKLNTPPITQIIPNFLSPTHVVFPYKLMSNVNGFLISSEEESRNEETYNIFTSMYKNKNYGATGFGLFAKANYPFTKFNSGIIRYNYSENFTNYLFKTDIKDKDDRDLKGDFETVFQKLSDSNPVKLSIGKSIANFIKAIDPDDKLLVAATNAISVVAKGCTLYFKRNVFIVIMELFLYLNKNVEKLATEIIAAAAAETPAIDITSEKETLKNRIKTYLDDYINKRYVEYLRYPLTESYQEYKKLRSLEGKPLTEIYPSPVQTAGGRRKKTKRLQIGGAGSCSQFELTDRTSALGKFDAEQYAPYNIFVLSWKNKEENNPVCELVNSDFPGNTGNAFSEWHNKVDIAGISALEIIDVGEKTYAIRSGRDDNNLEIYDLNKNIKSNWEGYTATQQGGGGAKLEEYEAQYDKLLNEITTTLGTPDGPAIAGGALAAEPVIHALYTSTMTCVSSISSAVCNTSTSVLYYTDYPINIINSAGKTIKLTMRSIDTILDLKKSVEAKVGIPSRDQHYLTIKPPRALSGGGNTIASPDPVIINHSGYISSMMCISTLSTISSPTCFVSTSYVVDPNSTSFATIGIDLLPSNILLNGMITLDALGSLHDALNTCLISIDPSFSSSIINIKSTDNTVTYYKEQQSGGGSVVNINMEFSMTGLTDKVNLTLVDATTDGSPFILKLQAALQKKFPGAMTRPLESDLHCPTGEMLDNTPVRCIPTKGSSPGIYVFTTKELYGTPTEQPNWIPTIVTGAVVGAVGLGALALSGESSSEIQKKKDGLLATTNVSPGGGGTYLQRKNAPILVKGEADLLNDLNLTPINMSEIFNVENKYATLYPNLAVWHKAIPAFFENLTTRKCYNNSLLLTRSECEETKCFLYSIRDYLNKGTGVQPNMNVMKGDVSDLNEPDIEADSDIVFSNTNMDPPQYRVEEEKATVRAAAIEKRTNHRWHFDIQLKDKAKDTKNNIVTPEEKEQLLEMFQNLKTKYPNYVLYLY